MIAREAGGNRPIDPEWFGPIATPGWQRRWLDNFATNQTLGMAGPAQSKI